MFYYFHPMIMIGYGLIKNYDREQMLFVFLNNCLLMFILLYLSLLDFYLYCLLIGVWHLLHLFLIVFMNLLNLLCWILLGLLYLCPLICRILWILHEIGRSFCSLHGHLSHGFSYHLGTFLILSHKINIRRDLHQIWTQLCLLIGL